MYYIIEGRAYYVGTDYVPAPERGYTILRKTFDSAADAESWIRAQVGPSCRDAETDLGTWVRIVDDSHAIADPADAEIVTRYTQHSTECLRREYTCQRESLAPSYWADCGTCPRCRAKKEAYPRVAGVLTVREQMARRAEYWRAVERYQQEGSHE